MQGQVSTAVIELWCGETLWVEGAFGIASASFFFAEATVRGRATGQKKKNTLLCDRNISCRAGMDDDGTLLCG